MSASETCLALASRLFIRTSRIRLERIVTMAAGGLMTVAENLAPADLRR